MLFYHHLLQAQPTSSATVLRGKQAWSRTANLPFPCTTQLYL